MVQAGRIRALAVIAPVRVQALPDVPALPVAPAPRPRSYAPHYFAVHGSAAGAGPSSATGNSLAHIASRLASSTR